MRLLRVLGRSNAVALRIGQPLRNCLVVAERRYLIALGFNPRLINTRPFFRVAERRHDSSKTICRRSATRLVLRPYCLGLKRKATICRRSATAARRIRSADAIGPMHSVFRDCCVLGFCMELYKPFVVPPLGGMATSRLKPVLRASCGEPCKILSRVGLVLVQRVCPSPRFPVV